MEYGESLRDRVARLEFQGPMRGADDAYAAGAAGMIQGIVMSGLPGGTESQGALATEALTAASSVGATIMRVRDAAIDAGIRQALVLRDLFAARALSGEGEV